MVKGPSDNRRSQIDLPSLPVALARVIEATSSPDATAESVAGAIMLDQALATKVLRMANSAFYGRLTRAETLSQAVVTLGYSTINNLAVASSVVDNLFPKESVRGFGWQEFWIHCVTCGAAAEVLLAQTGAPRATTEAVFVAGLLHDVGKLVIARAIPSRFIDVVNCCQIQRCRMIDAENAVLYTTHAHIGFDLAKQWNFPESLCAAIAYHHHNANNPNLPDVARTVKAANLLAKAIAPNYLLDIQSDVSMEEVAAIMRLEPRQMDAVVHRVELKMAQCEELLSWGDAFAGGARRAA